MLNISDIKERNHVEPIEVTEIRNNIINSFSRLRFEEEPHLYYLKQDDNSEILLPSVSSVTHQFEPYVDWDMKAEKYALDHNLGKEQVVRMWRENNLRATNTGTNTHLFGESYMYFFMGEDYKIPELIKPQYEEGFLIPHYPKEDAVVKFYEELFKIDNIYPVMPETQVYMGVSDEWQDVKPYAGTFDMLFTYKSRDGNWKLIILDYKTNASIYKSYSRDYGRMASAPFNLYYDEPYTYYILQLNCYAMCLMQLGYEIADMKLIWLKDDGTFEKIPIPDITSEVRRALKK